MSTRAKDAVLGWALLVLLVISASPAGAVEKVRGQLLFLPVYSEIPYGDRKASLNLAVTVTLRNLDNGHPITVRRVDYVDERGAVVRSLAGSVLSLKPMAATVFEIQESDRTGGRSAGVLIEWESGEGVPAPLLEGVMVNGAYNQGVAFVTSARVLSERH